MHEPATPLAAAFVAAASSITLSLFGVDYYSLLYGFLGALLGLTTNTDTMGRWRSMVFVALSTMVGAAGGNLVVAMVGSDSKPLLICSAIVVGAGALLLVSTAIQAGVNRLKQLGGQK